MTRFYVKVAGILVVVACMFALGGAYNSTQAVQRGNPGLGMDDIEKNSDLARKLKDNAPPLALPPAPEGGQLAVDAYRNVRVLGHLTSAEMTRLMTSIAMWVAPKQGCVYCHASQKDANGNVVKDADGVPQADQNMLWSDENYTKVVARRMLQMTMFINQEWKTHVKETGVTCYTCHRGNPVPTQLWFNSSPEDRVLGEAGHLAEQNSPTLEQGLGLTAMPINPLDVYFGADEPIRIISTEPLPIDNRLSIKQAEWTYSFMFHISSALGVNCTHCHNTRSMGEWNASPPARAQAWYGIRMVRQLNHGFLEPLTSTFPPERLGPQGDAPKINCATCHQGAYRPLLGAPMLKDFPQLAQAKEQPRRSIPLPPLPTPGMPAAPAAPAGAPPAPPTAPAPTAAPAQ